MRAPSVELLILQPTPFCNAACRYCYLPDRDDTRRMSRATFAAVMERVFESRFLGEALTVVWHAGEPLVLPPDYYREAMTLARCRKPEGLELSFHFQTNGMLLGPKWKEVLAPDDVKVGLSLDGPQDLHDRQRVGRDGRGTFAAAMAGVRFLQEIGKDFHVITVLTRKSLDAPDRLFDFYVAHGITQVAFNIEEIEAVNTESSLDDPTARPLYAAFLRRFLARLKSRPPGTLEVREFAGAAGAIGHAALHETRNPHTEAMRYLTVDVDGNVSTFAPELLGTRHHVYGDFTFGNLCRDSLETVFARVAASALSRDVDAGVAACRRSCDYFGLCGGGSPGNKIFETGTAASTETMFCRLAIQTVIDVMLSEIETELGLGPPFRRTRSTVGV